MTVTEPIFTKLAISEWHYMVILNITSRQNTSRNMGSTGRNSFIHLH